MATITPPPVASANGHARPRPNRMWQLARQRAAPAKQQTSDGFGALGQIISGLQSADYDWRVTSLDAGRFDTLPISRVLDLLTRLHPDLSSALWTFLRLTNPAWSYEVVDLPGRNQRPLTGRPLAATDAFVQRLNDHYRSINIMINRLFMAAFLRGGVLAELTLLNDRTPDLIVTPDPSILQWKRIPAEGDPTRHRWQIGQYEPTGRWAHLEYPTVAYTPIDPLPDTPWGRPLAEPAVFVCVFLLGLLHDLKRVVQQQGYPRLDIAVDIAAIAEPYGDDGPQTYDEMRDFANAVITQVQSVYSTLKPDDAYIHDSSIAVNKPVGAVDTSVLGGIDTLVRVLERMSIRALKTLPVLMGVNESTTETHARIQWRVYQRNIASLQADVAGLLNYLLTQALRVQGLPGYVIWTFTQLDASDQYTNAQTRQLEIANARAAYDHGYIDQDAAAAMAVGVAKADQPAPRTVESVPNSPTPEPSDVADE